jgi:hypothetical protein
MAFFIPTGRQILSIDLVFLVFTHVRLGSNFEVKDARLAYKM